MLYPLLTAIAGAIIFIVALVSLVRALKDNDAVVAPFRFALTGILLILHAPLTTAASDFILTKITAAGRAPEYTDWAFWAALITVVAVQLAVLPTSREIFAERTWSSPSH